MNSTEYSIRNPKSGLALQGVAAALLLAFGTGAWALPTGGAVSAGGASISSSGGTTTIGQSTDKVAINWQGFSIAQGETVRFVQPGSGSVALNRVLGSDPSSILGNLSANGKVFLVNPNGILFGQGAQVNVGALVASTLNISDSDFMAGRYRFSGAGNGDVLNQGSINAPGGYVALLGARVSNEGTIVANMGMVALAAGNAMTLDVAGDGLLNVSVDQGLVNALVENRGLIRADGGSVLLTAQAAGNLLQTAVNNSGVIQAQTLQNHKGTIKLLGDMQSGTMSVDGRLDASAPNGGNGGFIETSAARVSIRDSVVVTTAAAQGLTGTWLIDPQDFIVGAGGNITGATLGAQLVTNSVEITTAPGPGNGDIFINQAVTWVAAPTTTTLTLTAFRDVNINAAITATNGNLSVCCGRDVNVNGAITTVNGSILLAAGRNVSMAAAVSATDGNISMCAGHDVLVNAALTLVRGSSIPAQSLGLPLGLVLSAGNDGTGPGTAGGTVTFGALTPPAAVTGPNAPVTITYNPVSYASPTDYSGKFTLVTSTLTQRMLVFPGGADRGFDGSTLATLTTLVGNPAGVSLVPGAGNTANFDTSASGLLKTINFTGYTLGGPNAANFALPSTCCGTIVGKTRGNIFPITPLAALIASAGPLLATSSLLVMSEALLRPFSPPRSGLVVTEAGTPPVTLVQTFPPEIVPPPVPAPEVVPVVVPPPAPPAPPLRPRKQDRN